MNTWHIHIKGQVQGVGFRPFVYVLAHEYALTGWVNNTVDGVHVVFNADRQLAEAFEAALIARAPALSRITSSELHQTQASSFDHFQIIHSATAGKASLLLTPDFALCPTCRSELRTPGHRRTAYPFITCTHCGPRFSIIHQLPYDRAHTKMDTFTMCSDCQKEYENPLDRRYHSQTNSCPACAIQLSLFDANQNKITEDKEQILAQIPELWRSGKIVAIKGIGGYLLTCDAHHPAAIANLRARKYRPSKPFALMFPNVQILEDAVYLDPSMIQELEGHVSPIVLVTKKETAKLPERIAPHLNQIGVMLPYTPLYQLLLDRFDGPIVATSGNRSHAPIVFEDQKALSTLSSIADFILLNNRAIVVPQDDSVLKYSTFKKHKIILRRSRGFAPTYINADLKLANQTILATGAMLKSTFSFLHQKNTYISQYLGDLGDFDTQQSYQSTIQHFLDLFQTPPELILADQHPEYPSTQLGESFSEQWTIPIQKIQHHIAHFGAILGEHNLVDSPAPILGVIWDGTGLGQDQQIWGGEFFKYENYDFLRCYHFDYFDGILGDKMPKEPRISALSACWDVMGAEAFLKEKFSPTEWQIYTTLLSKKDNLQTSSVGRIFDAVASLLDLLDKQTFEGEAAMRLEILATQYFEEHGLDFSSSYFLEGAHYYRIPTQSLMTNIIMDLQKGKTKAFIAAKFHFSLVKLIKIVATNLKITRIAFSGGVFQNSLLIDLILQYLAEDFKLYFHQQLAPNDENISFGQLVCHQISKQKESFLTTKTKQHVFSNSR